MHGRGVDLAGWFGDALRRIRGTSSGGTTHGGGAPADPGDLDRERETLEEKVRERTAELTRAYNELKRLDELKDGFLSSVSHELRTPLSSIRAFSEILLTGGEDADTRREFLEIINKESVRLTRLIDDLLDLSRIESGRAPWRLEWVDLAVVIRQSIDGIQALAEQSRLSVEAGLPPDLPHVWADADRLVQVMTNLLGNSIKFTPEGGKIRVEAREVPGSGPADPDRLLEVRVSDSGSGIPEKDLEAVFEKFRQAGGTLTGKPKGTGLGLPICREIVTRLGGRIWAERVVGSGAAVAFVLPLGGCRPVDAAPTIDPLRGLGAGPAQSLRVDLPGPARERAPRADPLRKRPVVAVADDDPSVREVVGESLRARGFDVVLAADGAEVLEQAKARPFDLLILDLQMPKVSGWKVLRAMKSDTGTAGVPIIVLTGWDGEGDRARALSMGAVEYLQKGQGLTRLCTEIEMATGTLPARTAPRSEPTLRRSA